MGFFCIASHDQQMQHTKTIEQNIRIELNTPVYVVLAESTLVTDSQASILGNWHNKSQLIGIVKQWFYPEGIKCYQSQADADYMLTQITLETADTPDRPIVQVGEDTDMLTKLVHSMKTSNVYMWFRSG